MAEDSVTVERVDLLDEDGELQPKFEDALAYIFQKYCSVPASSSSVTSKTSSADRASASEPNRAASSSSPRPASPIPLPRLGSRPPRGAVITDIALDRFAYETNGAPFPDESKEELKQFLDCDDQGRLTYEGFLGMFHLQADNDLDETWKDLSTHGFERNLNLVSTRREEQAGQEEMAGVRTEKPEGKAEEESQAQNAANQDPSSTLLIPLHVKHILRLSSNTTSLAYHLSTHLRINGVYWGLMALELMGKGEELEADKLVDFVMSCWDRDSGGFGSYPRHDAHLLSTCSAIQILAIKDRLDVLDKEKVINFILSLQNPSSNLFFGDTSRLEEDTRFSYCAILAMSLLGAKDRLDRKATIDGILACSNFDGGFGWVEGSESHAGGAFVCVAALAILGALPQQDLGKGEETHSSSPPFTVHTAALSQTSVDKLSSWLSERQLPDGGLNGRPQKLEDVCYSWWVLSALSILGRLHWIDSGKLVKFILSAQDPDSGGIADRPDNVSDVFHTFFGLAGLSLLDFQGLGSPQETKGRRVDPIYALPERVVERLGLRTQYQRL